MAKRKQVRQKSSTAKAKTKAISTTGPNDLNAKPSKKSEKRGSLAVRKAPSKTAGWFPAKSELALLYQRYTNGAQFDDHDKAFYFVIDVGGISQARQLIAHVEEVLAELEEFRE
jgi:hypothetical protein